MVVCQAGSHADSIENKAPDDRGQGKQKKPLTKESGSAL